MGAVHEALCRAIADCGEGLSKDRQAQGGAYKFRGIDQVLNFLNPIMARHKLALVPSNITDEQVVERQTKAGGAMYFARAKVEFRLYHESGEGLTVMVWSEAMDTSDKALNKVMSIAWKYAAIQTFCIPIEDVADENPHSADMAPQRGAEPQRAPEPQPPPPPPQFLLEQFMFGELSGALVTEAAPGTIERYMGAIDAHVKRHPEFTNEDKQVWRRHFASCRLALNYVKEQIAEKLKTDDIPY